MMLNLQLLIIVIIFLDIIYFISIIEGYSMKKSATLLKRKQKKSGVGALKEPLPAAKKLVSKRANVIVEGVDSIEKIDELKEMLSVTIKENFIDNVTAIVELREKSDADTKGSKTKVNILKEITSNTKNLHESIQNIKDIRILKYITLNIIFGPAGHNEELQIFDGIVNNLGNNVVAQRLPFIRELVKNIIDAITQLKLSDSEKKDIKQLSTAQDTNTQRDILTQLILGDVGCIEKKINVRQLKSMITDKGNDGNTKKQSPLCSDCGKKKYYNKCFFGPVMMHPIFNVTRRVSFDSVSSTEISRKIHAMDIDTIKELLFNLFGNVQVMEKMINVFTLLQKDLTEDIDLLKDIHNISKTSTKLIQQSKDLNSLQEIATNMVYATNLLLLKIINTDKVKTLVSQFLDDLDTAQLDEVERDSKFLRYILGGVGCIGKVASQEALKDNDDIERLTLINFNNVPIKYGNDVIEYDWPMGIVPYYIDTASYDSIIADRIQSSMKSIETVSCVVFRELTERPNGTYIWVHITNPNNERDCVHRMAAGRRGSLEMVLGYNCIQARHIIHSLFHVLGFQDEVTHPQRDSYVRIYWNNIQPKYRQLFGIRTPSASKPLVEYDTTSIMHFHDRAYSWNGRATISSLIPGLLISPSEYMSQLDIMKLRLAFGHQCHKQRIYNFYETCKNVLLSKENESEEARESDDGEHLEKEQTPKPSTPQDNEKLESTTTNTAQNRPFDESGDEEDNPKIIELQKAKVQNRVDRKYRDKE